MTLAALTLWQPFASLMFPSEGERVKTAETRGWSTPSRGDVLICSAKRRMPMRELGPWYYAGFHCNADMGRGENEWWNEVRWQWGSFPLGAALGIARLRDVLPIIDPDDCDWDEERTESRSGRACAHAAIDDQVIIHEPGQRMHTTCLVEEPYGDYTPGRYAWVFDEFRPLGEPRARIGHQGLRELPLNEEQAWRNLVSEP